ncbi:MAG: VWA domain-containing protein [Armatimonadota bacterium]|nr:VWA domain-containing protein [Armatimonadota bacterium]MDR7528745.1 VWA domain-containing protein [Armatimonadota bacterium]
MDARILEFIGELRRADLRVSTPEALDALQAAATVGLEDRETFRAALAATLVKDARDRATFDRLFDLFFFDLRALGAEAARALGRDDPWARRLLERLLTEGGIALDPLTELLVAGDPAALEALVRQGARQAGLERLFYFLQVGYFSRRIWEQLPWERLTADLEALLAAAEAAGLDPGVLARLRTYLDLRLEAFRRLIRQHVERELARRDGPRREPGRRELLQDRPLFTLSAEEVAQMRAVVARLARKIRDALVLRQRRERRGSLDPKRTLRASLQYGGVPADLRWRRRRRERPRLVTLCDVSDSVRNASRFMLQLVWSLQDCFAKVQSFVFVSEIAEVTATFRVLPVEQALDHALAGAGVDYHSRSDFGYAFARFCREWLDRLDRRTTLLILGDARNNYNDPQAWTLRLLRERVRGIIWLNPEGRWGWGVGDSVMPLYAPHCDVVRECRTLAQLAEVVDGLVQGWWRRRAVAR